MSAEVIFKRPGRVEIKVSTCASGRVYASVMQRTTHGWQHLVSANCFRPKEECRLIDHGDSWVLEVSQVRFSMKQKEFRQLRDLFGDIPVTEYRPDSTAQAAVGAQS